MPIPVQRTTTYPSGIHRFLSYNTSNTDFLAFCSSEPKEILKITDERIYTSNITVLGNIEFGADTGVLRNRIQVSPSRKVFYVDTSTQSVFNLSVEGIFGGYSSNADVCVNQNKLSYLNSNYADYDLTYAFTTGSNTDYTVTLTQAAVFGDIVDITLWPQLIQQSTPLSGYVYQGVSFTYFNKTTPTGSDIYYLGNVGIGTILPLANLQIGATAQTAGSGTNYYNYAKQLALLGDYNVAPNSGDSIKLYIGNYNNDSAPNVYPILCEDENEYLDFFVKARATSALLPTMYFAGNIGVGTTAPTQALHVVGNALVTGNLTVTGSNITNINYINSIEYNSSNVIINNVSGAGPALKVSQTGVGASYPIADFYDNDVSTTIPAFRIADGGNVGIGTATPISELHVYSGALGGTSGNTLDHIRTSCTSTNVTNLRIYEQRHTTGTDWQTTSLILQRVVDVTNQAFIKFGVSGATAGLTLGAANTEAVRINDSGLVGIGTTVPTEKLHVVGNIKAQYLNTSHPCFQAYYSGANISATTVILWNNIVLNNGSCYNSANGRFTAPVNGIYWFSFHTLAVSAGGTGVQFIARKNGVNLADTRTESTYGNTTTVSWAQSLDATQYIDIIIQLNTMYGAGYNNFSGYLITAI